MVRETEIIEPGIVVPAKIVSVYDGDTVTARVTLDVQVRLLDCWAPEVKGADRVKGLKSRDTLRELILDKDVLVSVPLTGADRLDDVFTFGRVLGRVYIDKEDVSKIMVRQGYAKKEKE